MNRSRFRSLTWASRGRALWAVVAGFVALVTACASPARVADPFPATPPAPLAERRLEFPPFHEATLANGLRVIVLEHHSQPLVQVNLYVGAGRAADPVGQAGLAGMTADLLTKGTLGRTAVQIAEEIERVGGTLGASAGADWLTLSANVLSEHLELAMELVSEVAIRPTFPTEEVDLTRLRTLSSLQAALGQPSQIARRTLDREVYGVEHPYGIAPLPASVQGVTRDEIRAFHERHFAAANALLVIAGDVGVAQAEAMANRFFGGWRTGERATIHFPVVPSPPATEIRLVHRPGSAQTTVLVGHLGYPTLSDDHFALQVLNGIVGGHPDARLNFILREERGWTYGAFSQFTRLVDIGAFIASAEVRPEVTDSTIVEMLTQLRAIREERVPEEELAATKGFLAGSFPLRIETAGQIAGSVANVRLLGLPVENLTEYRERILAVTAEDVQRVARQYLRPDQAVVVVVGDARELYPRLQAIAPVRLLDVQGEPLEPDRLADSGPNGP